MAEEGMVSDRFVPSLHTDEPALRAEGLTKFFGSILALENVSIEAHAGSVLGVVGDNGAGKSTLVKILAGVLSPDAGKIYINGALSLLTDPISAREAGVATVFQDLALVEPLDVAANLFLGHEPRRGPFVNRRRMIQEAEVRLASLNIRVPSVRTAVGLLSGGQRQGIAIARAVLQGARVIIMDEPTAALGVQETRRVEEIIDGLRHQGCAVILICHDLELVMRLSDRIQVMRLGHGMPAVITKDTHHDRVVGMITGTVSPP